MKATSLYNCEQHLKFLLIAFFCTIIFSVAARA
jgi:hypothetical protein